MSFVSLKSLLSRAVHQAGLDQSVSSARIVDEAQAAIQRIWSAEKAQYVQVVSCVGDTLKVAVRAPAAMFGLRLIEMAWINEINRTLGRVIVKKIMVKREGF